MLLSSASSLAGSMICRLRTSRMMLPLSVVNPSRSTGCPPSFTIWRATGLRAAAALDEMQIFRGLVGAVDVQRKFVDAVEGQHWYAVFLESFRRGHRTGHCAVDLMLDRRQRVDEEIGGGTGADANDGAGLHITQCRFRHRLFECVL